MHPEHPDPEAESMWMRQPGIKGIELHGYLHNFNTLCGAAKVGKNSQDDAKNINKIFNAFVTTKSLAIHPQTILQSMWQLLMHSQD